MNRFNRRQLLKAGGMAFTLPVLESLPFMNNIASAATASGSLKRVFFFVLTNGWYEDVIFPKSKSWTVGPEGVRYIPLNSISGDISQFFTAAKYNAYRSKMNIMRGFDVIGGAPAGGHDTKMPLCAAGRGSSAQPNSIEVVLGNAAQFYPATPFKKSLNISPAKGWRDDFYNYSFEGGRNRSAIGGPSALFTELFSTTLPSTGSTGTGGTTTPAPVIDTNLSRRLAMVEAIKKLNAYSTSSRFSVADQRAFAKHASDLNGLLPTVAAPAGTGGGSTGGGTVSVGGSCAMPTKPSGFDESFEAKSGIQARMRAILNMIYMGFNCQLTNTAVFHPLDAWDTGMHMGDTGGDVYHQLAGHTRNVPKYIERKGFIFDQLLYFLNLMETTKESNGLSMLDNSLVVVISNDACSEHSNQDMPVITFGSLGGSLKTGNYINYQRTDAPSSEGSMAIENAPDAAGNYRYKYTYNLGRPLNQFYTTILNVLKIPHSGFGDYSSGGNYAAFTSATGKQANLPIIT